MSKEIKCPKELNQFLIGEPFFENVWSGEDCERAKFYGDCYHCFATAIAKRDTEIKLEVLESLLDIIGRERTDSYVWGSDGEEYLDDRYEDGKEYVRDIINDRIDKLKHKN